jgi:predicted N-acetyltransferase YhbS
MKVLVGGVNCPKRPLPNIRHSELPTNPRQTSKGESHELSIAFSPGLQRGYGEAHPHLFRRMHQLVKSLMVTYQTLKVVQQMNLARHYLSGKQYLSTVTELLQHIRLESAFEGLYEAADLQWRWREDDAAFPERQVFWFDSRGQVVACFLRYDAGTEWNNDFMYLPSVKQAVEKHILPQVIAEFSNPDKASIMTIREDDTYLRNAMEAVGYVQSANTLALTELEQDPDRTLLASGFYLTSRVEDSLPHHLIRRNGTNIALKLSECSLYRPELDLCIRDASSNVAAYALFWFDPVTKVGLLEPLRTEKVVQRMGLSRHLIAEGVARFRELGAESIRVAYFIDNLAAKNLYQRMGFVERLKMLEYRLDVEK